MFETFHFDVPSIARHEKGPFAEERFRYLVHCAERGDTPRTLQNKRTGIYWAAHILGPNAGQDITAEQFQAAARQWAVDHGYHRPNSVMQLIRVARPWLRYLGWWKDPVIDTPFQAELDRFCHWMKSERGLTATTIDQWRRRTRTFLQWYQSTGRSLGELVPIDIDQYLIHGINSRCRITVATYLTALRAFIRYAGSQGWCTPRLADTIQRPRLYKNEQLPSGPDWSDVRLLLQDLDTGHPRDVRNYAIVLLLAVYGMRVGEVIRLRLTDLDWERELVRLPRAKRRAPQRSPLVAEVGNSIARYLRNVRPKSTVPEVFLSMRPPYRRLSQGALYSVIGPRMRRLGCALAHFGPHALRHACAQRLLASGLTLKEIGDHLGHRSPASTQIYTKVDLLALREVAAFDLGGVQ
jgi:integrase/recombinase XerD